MPKTKKIKAWAVIGSKNKITTVFHGKTQKEEIMNYNIVYTKKEGKRCIKLHCENDPYYKVIPIEITLKP